MWQRSGTFSRVVAADNRLDHENRPRAAARHADKADNVARGLRAFEPAAQGRRCSSSCLCRARLRAVLSAEPGRRRRPARSPNRCPARLTDAFAAKARELGVVARAEPVRARRRADVRLLAGDRRRRHAARPHADDSHHGVRLLSRAGLLHAGRHAARRSTRRKRATSAWRSATTATIRSTCARSRSPAPTSSSCRRPDRSASGRRGCTKRRCASPRFRTATSSRSATGSGRRSG